MDIRKLNDMDLTAALTLIEEVFMEFEAPDYSEKGVKNFLSFIKKENIREQIQSSDIRMEFWGCFHQDKVVGVLAIRNVFHISLLFVDKAYQRQGIAKALLQSYLNEIIEDKSGRGWNLVKQIRITVNSSPYAVPIYERMGFHKVRESMTRNGIRFTPMVKEL